MSTIGAVVDYPDILNYNQQNAEDQLRELNRDRDNAFPDFFEDGHADDGEDIHGRTALMLE